MRGVVNFAEEVSWLFTARWFSHGVLLTCERSSVLYMRGVGFVFAGELSWHVTHGWFLHGVLLACERSSVFCMRGVGGFCFCRSYPGTL